MKESLLKFKHATIDTDVEVAAPLIFSIYLNQKVGSTLLISNGGAIIPVKETVQEAKDKLEQFYSLKENNKNE